MTSQDLINQTLLWLWWPMLHTTTIVSLCNFGSILTLLLCPYSELYLLCVFLCACVCDSVFSPLYSLAIMEPRCFEMLRSQPPPVRLIHKQTLTHTPTHSFTLSFSLFIILPIPGIFFHSFFLLFFSFSFLHSLIPTLPLSISFHPGHETCRPLWCHGNQSKQREQLKSAIATSWP